MHSNNRGTLLKTRRMTKVPASSALSVLLKTAVAVLLGWRVEVTQSQEITGFTLVDAESDNEIRPLTRDNGNVINLALDGTSLSIRADTTTSGEQQVGSVQFDLDDTMNHQTESVAPYALNGDVDGDYFAEPILTVLGSHTITATIYSGSGGSGTALDSETIALTTIQGTDGAPVAPTPTIAPTTPITEAPITMPTLVSSGQYDVVAYNHGPNGELTGELKKWHKITLGFTGPNTSETAIPNPFTDYRLAVTFTNHYNNGTFTFVVPGYYAADGNAANSGASSGNVWLVHFVPNSVGPWTWSSSFLQGMNVAQDLQLATGPVVGYMHGLAGQFLVNDTDKTNGRDFRSKGKLQYVKQHHLQFAETGEWFLKVGADSPENLLAYQDFDNTPNNGNRRKSWNFHVDDYRNGDPTWAGGKGRGIVGAINYLALVKGMNAFSFLTMNIRGDDQNVFPYISDGAQDRLRIDVSKTAQWEVLFEHADRIGLYLHFKTQETENDQLLDGGELGLERKLYYRELIARFGHHLALNWNIGEENTNTNEQRKAFADYFHSIDPYKETSNIVVHTYPSQKDLVYGPLLGINSSFTGASLQSNPDNVFPDTLQWVTQSAVAGKKWVVANDEQGNAQTGVVPDLDDPTHDDIRKNVLWGNIMAGGAGVEYYFGYSFPNSDLTCQDFRSRENMWTQSRYALDFFEDHVPFWRMKNRNNLVSSSSAWCLGSDDDDDRVVFVVYLRNGETTNIELPAGFTFTVKWFDPRNGGDLQDGSTTTVSGGGGSVSLGSAPNNNDKDWTVLVSSVSFPTAASLSPSPSIVQPLTQTPSMMISLTTQIPSVSPTTPAIATTPDTSPPTALEPSTSPTASTSTQQTTLATTTRTSPTQAPTLLLDTSSPTPTLPSSASPSIKLPPTSFALTTYSPTWSLLMVVPVISSWISLCVSF